MSKIKSIILGDFCKLLQQLCKLPCNVQFLKCWWNCPVLLMNFIKYHLIAALAFLEMYLPLVFVPHYQSLLLRTNCALCTSNKSKPGLGSPAWSDAPAKLHPDTCSLWYTPVWQHLSGVVFYWALMRDGAELMGLFPQEVLTLQDSKNSLFFF